MTAEPNSLFIHDCDQLKDLNGLRGITDLGPGVAITANSALVDFCGLRAAIANNWKGSLLVEANKTNSTVEEIVTECGELE